MKPFWAQDGLLRFWSADNDALLPLHQRDRERRGCGLAGGLQQDPTIYQQHVPSPGPSEMALPMRSGP